MWLTSKLRGAAQLYRAAPVSLAGLCTIGGCKYDFLRQEFDNGNITNDD